MEAEETPTNASKRYRIANGVGVGIGGGKEEDEDDGDRRRCGGVGVNGGGGAGAAAWAHPSSRIYRVSRASGGKDRHSKVYTAKGLRDRRVRLSVPTAIQFYDLQDRLGFDQPSKAIEWLIKAASAAIDELPSLDGSFPEPPPPRQILDNRDAIAAAESEADTAYAAPPHPQFSKSGCSSTSETSKGSVLSLSRSESRVKARERARKRTAKDKEDDPHDVRVNPHQHNETSFTELLTSGGASNGATAAAAAAAAVNLWHLPAATTADYFGQEAVKTHQILPTISSQSPHYGNSGTLPFTITAAAAVTDHQEMQQFSFLQEEAAAAAAAGESLGFSITSGLAGFSRGTLQSNSTPSHQLPHNHHHHHNLQRFSSPVDGSNLSFFFSPTAQGAAASAESQFSAGFDSRLHLWDGYRHSDLKGKGKN